MDVVRKKVWLDKWSSEFLSPFLTRNAWSCPFLIFVAFGPWLTTIHFASAKLPSLLTPSSTRNGSTNPRTKKRSYTAFMLPSVRSGPPLRNWWSVCMMLMLWSTPSSSVPPLRMLRHCNTWRLILDVPWVNSSAIMESMHLLSTTICQNR